MTRREFRTHFISRLVPLYDEREVQAMLRWYVEDRLAMAPHLFFLDLNLPMPTNVDFMADVERLAQGEPLQHVTGLTEFYGLRFNTDRRALIPRPETEEMVDEIARRNRLSSGLRVLDIGTGTGIIAISLALSLPAAQVDAIDISEDALALARSNAESNGVKVNFLRNDILATDELPHPYDIIVSNPPYIPESTRAQLHRNVTEYEPAQALFVPDDDPLVFYRKISQLAWKSLVPYGELYFETYEEFHPQLETLLRETGFTDVACRNDFNGRPRFARAVKIGNNAQCIMSNA